MSGQQSTNLPSTPFQRHQARTWRPSPTPPAHVSPNINNAPNRYKPRHQSKPSHNAALPDISTSWRPIVAKPESRLTRHDGKNTKISEPVPPLSFGTGDKNIEFNSGLLSDPPVRIDESTAATPPSNSTSPHDPQVSEGGGNNHLHNTIDRSALPRSVQSYSPPGYPIKASPRPSVISTSATSSLGDQVSPDHPYVATSVASAWSESRIDQRGASDSAYSEAGSQSAKPFSAPLATVTGPKQWNCAPVSKYGVSFDHPLYGSFASFVYGVFDPRKDFEDFALCFPGQITVSARTKNRILSYCEALYDIGDLDKYSHHPKVDLFRLLSQYSWEIREYHVRSRVWRDDVLPEWFHVDSLPTVNSYYARVGIVENLDGMSGFGLLSESWDRLKTLELLVLPHCVAFKWIFDEGWINDWEFASWNPRIAPFISADTQPPQYSISSSSSLNGPAHGPFKKVPSDTPRVRSLSSLPPARSTLDSAFLAVPSSVTSRVFEEPRDDVFMPGYPSPDIIEHDIKQRLIASSRCDTYMEPNIALRRDKLRKHNPCCRHCGTSSTYSDQTASDKQTIPGQVVDGGIECLDYISIDRQIKIQTYFPFDQWKLGAGRRKSWACTVFMKFVKQVKIKTKLFGERPKRYVHFLPATLQIPSYLATQQLVGTRQWKTSHGTRKSDCKRVNLARTLAAELKSTLSRDDTQRKQRGAKSTRIKTSTSSPLQRLKSIPQSFQRLLNLKRSPPGDKPAADGVFVELENFCGTVIAGKYQLHKMVATSFHFSTFEASRLIGYPSPIEARRFCFAGITRECREDRLESLHKQRVKPTYVDTVDELGSYWVISRIKKGKTISQPRPSGLSFCDTTSLQRGTIKFETTFPLLKGCRHANADTERSSPSSDNYVTYAEKVKGVSLSPVLESREIVCAQEKGKPKCERQRRRRQRKKMKQREIMQPETSSSM